MVLTDCCGFMGLFLFGGFCVDCDLLIDDVHLEDSCSVVREHSTVEEEFGQSKVNHPVILSDDGVDSVVHQCVVLMRQVKKHPLQTQNTLSSCHNISYKIE